MQHSRYYIKEYQYDGNKRSRPRPVTGAGAGRGSGECSVSEFGDAILAHPDPMSDPEFRALVDMLVMLLPDDLSEWMVADGQAEVNNVVADEQDKDDATAAPDPRD